MVPAQGWVVMMVVEEQRVLEGVHAVQQPAPGEEEEEAQKSAREGALEAEGAMVLLCLVVVAMVHVVHGAVHHLAWVVRVDQIVLERQERVRHPRQNSRSASLGTVVSPTPLLILYLSSVVLGAYTTFLRAP